jgi:hypothetical protein
LDFYYHRRNLEDAADVIVRVLYEEPEPEKDRFDLDVLADDCVSGWCYCSKQSASLW